MIVQIPNNKTFSNYEKMINTIKPTQIDDEVKLRKRIERGDDVFVYINPYDAEMSSSEEIPVVRLGWKVNKEDATNTYYTLAENV